MNVISLYFSCMQRSQKADVDNPMFPDMLRIFMKSTLCNISPGTAAGVSTPISCGEVTTRGEEEHELGFRVKNVSISRVVAKLFSILRKHSPVLPPVQNKDIRITAKLSPNSWQQDYFNSPSYYNIIMYNGRGNVIHYNLLIAQSIQNFILFLFCSFHILYFYKIIFCCSCFIFLCVLRLHFWVKCALH